MKTDNIIIAGAAAVAVLVTIAAAAVPVQSGDFKEPTRLSIRAG